MLRLRGCILVSLATLAAITPMGCGSARVATPEPQERPARARPPRVWTLDHPARSAEAEPPRIAYWRERHARWKSGTLRDYPFSAYNTPLPAFDPAPLGKLNAKGRLVTTPPVNRPTSSVHETEPWGDPGCVWPIEARWSMEWERRYSDWIATEVDPHFLARHNIAVDCADAPYALRWIFARMHRLPQGVHTIHGAVFGNWNTRFAEIPEADDWREDARFFAALNYIMDTHIQGRSIPYDTYPIALAPRAGAIRPGTLVADRTHVRIIHAIDPRASRPIRHLSATLPAKVRPLADESLSDAIENHGPGWGIVNWSWWEYDFARRRYLCVPDEKMPGYSIEQYSFFDGEIAAGWLHEQYRHAELRSAPPDPRQTLRELLRDMAEALRVRQEVVDDSWAYYSRRPKDRDKESLRYDEFSTPNRDARLLRLLEAIRGVAEEHGITRREVDRELAAIPIRASEAQSTDALRFAEALIRGKASSEPWDPPHIRWGLRKP